MKTPEEIKKGMECCAEYGDRSKGCPYNPIKDCGHDLYSDALAYIQQLERERDAAMPKWISVEKRLPEDGVRVLVHGFGEVTGSVIAITEYTRNMYGYSIEGWNSPWMYFSRNYKITHWMPLPEAPDEK